MKIAIIGRTEILYNTTRLLIKQGHSIVCILTSKEAPEYLKTRKDFLRLAEELGVPYSSTSRIFEQEEMLKNAQADIAVSMNYSSIIPYAIIDLFPLGILNAHGGDLPRYRGNACQTWAILNEEDRIGLCIHRMDEKLDSGDIIVRDYISIDHNTKVSEVLNRFSERIPAMFLEAIIKLAKNPDFVLQLQSTDPKDALRCYPRIPSDGEIDWNMSAWEINKLIRAAGTPYSGAYTFFEDVQDKGKIKKLSIDAAYIESFESDYCAVPGHVLRMDGGQKWGVVCGDKKILVLEKIRIDGEDVPVKFHTVRQRLGIDFSNNINHLYHRLNELEDKLDRLN